MKYEQIELSAGDDKKWETVRALLLWKVPAFSHIFYKMLDNAKSKHIALFTRDVAIAATDGVNLLLNPDSFFKLTLPKQVFVVSHEILHCIFNHMAIIHTAAAQGTIKFPDGSKLPFHHETMNVAMDYVINAILVDSNVGEFDASWCLDKDVAKATDSVLDVYKKIYDPAKAGGGGGGSGDIGKGTSFDQHLAPGASQGKDPHQAKGERNETEWGTQIAAAANAARAVGRMPAGLDRVFRELLTPQVDWRDKIAALFARKTGSGGFDWRRPDRRLIVRDIYAPGRSGYGAGTVVLAADTSGSIGDRELDVFFAEMAGLLEDVRPKRLVIVWCDAKVHRADEAEDPSDLNVIRYKGAPGGGGTNFVPVFEWVKSEGIQPEALVYLTDGEGQFPKAAPNYPVIWGSISKPGKINYPFGDVVDVPLKAT